jgi:methionyl-tRNA synthetase
MSRFSQCFELASFSLNQAAELVTQHLDRLRNHAVSALAEDLDRDALRVRLGDLFLQLRALISGASPILIDLAADAARTGNFPLRITPTPADITHAAPFPLPTLDLHATGARTGTSPTATRMI